MLMVNQLSGFGAFSADGGGNDSFTKLLLHCDGADTSTTFTDSSASAHTVTANGNGQVDTGQSKFGGASYQGDGTGDSLTVTYSAALLIGTGDFTIDAWVRQTSAASDYLFSNRDGSGTTDAFTVEIQADGSVRFITEAAVLATTATGLITAGGAFQHIEVGRSGTTVKIFIDGTERASFTHGADISATNNWTIGGDYAGDSFGGHIDEFRASIGIARHTSGFTPPIGPYF